MYTSMHHTKDDERREREKLSENEKQVILDDIHGRQQHQQGGRRRQRQEILVENEGQQQQRHYNGEHTVNINNNRGINNHPFSGDNITSEHYREFDKVLDEDVPFDMQTNFWYAWIDHEQLVHNESDFRWFILMSNYDMKKAAMSLCEYWNLRVEIFGDVNAFKPLSLRHNPGLRDVVEFFHNCSTNLFYKLPDDDFGRSVWFYDGTHRPPYKEYKDIIDLKFFMYFYLQICKSEPNYDPRKNEIVFLDMNKSSLVEVQTTRFMKLAGRLSQIAPFKVVCYHMIGTSSFLHLLASIYKFAMSREWRLRTKDHLLKIGDSRYQSSLLNEFATKYGLQSKNLPTAIGGTYDESNDDAKPVWVEEAEQILQEEKRRKKRKIAASGGCDRRER